jgi:FtsP/CotA-like multicopper oxidase with cupredoxin domain
MVFTRLVGAVSFLTFALNAFAAPHAVQFTKRADTVKFEVDLTWEDVNPIGGATKKGILINGTSPGPALNLNFGDSVEFLVHNNMDEPTTIHFHGISQAKTPWSDGVPGLSQKAIQPGESFLYQWEADESGTYWYHAHFRSQIIDGCFGAIVIKSSKDAKRPWSFISNDTEVQKQLTAADDSLQPVFVSDYVDMTSAELHATEEEGNLDIACVDAILINGKGSRICKTQDEINALTSPRYANLLANVPSGQLTGKGCLPPLPQTQGANFTFNVSAIPSSVYFDCTASEGNQTKIEVDASKGWAAITFIGSAGIEIFKYTIDGHKFWVYAVDGQYVVPQLVDTVVLNNGDRQTVMIKLDQPAADYTIRVTNQGLNQIISGFATLSYKGAASVAGQGDSLAIMDYAGTNKTLPLMFAPPKAVPFPPRNISQTVDQTFIFTTKKMLNPYTWTLTGSETFNVTREDSTPLLFQQPSNVPEDQVIIRTQMGQWIDLIIKIAGPLAQPHPFHKHANKAYLIGQGVGDFPWASIAEAQASGALPPTAINTKAAPCKFDLRCELHLANMKQSVTASHHHLLRATLLGSPSATTSRLPVPSSSTATFRPT